MVAPLVSPTTPQTLILAATRSDGYLAGASRRCAGLQGKPALPRRRALRCIPPSTRRAHVIL